MERVEINNDLTRSEPIREVRQTKDARTSEATKKKFVAELENRLPRKKKKKGKKEKDEIILHDEEKSREEEKQRDNTKEKRDKGNRRNPAPSPDGEKGKEVDFLA